MLKLRLNHRRGQSAAEYLATYGWAILVVSIATIAAWQFGLFKLETTIGSGYSGFGEVIPADFKLDKDGDFTIVLKNAAGGPIYVAGVTAQMGGVSNSSTDACNISAGDSENFTITGLPGGSPGESYRWLVVVVNFTDMDTGAEHSSAGDIWGNYED